MEMSVNRRIGGKKSCLLLNKISEIIVLKRLVLVRRLREDAALSVGKEEVATISISWLSSSKCLTGYVLGSFPVLTW